MGTGGAGNTTNNFSADSSFTNPAGMTGLERDSILTGLQLVIPKVEFDSSLAGAGGSDGGNAGEIAVIPSFFYVKKLPDDLSFGFSITGPLGGGVDYGDNFVGRYGAQEVLLQGLAFSPSLGYKVNDQFSVGANTPLSELVTAIEDLQPNILALSASRWSTDEGTLNRAYKELPVVCNNNSLKLIIGGSGAWPSNIDYGHRCRSYEDLKVVLNTQPINTPRPHEDV